MEKTLVLNTAFGPSRDETLLLTHHPDEYRGADGRPRPDGRTLVLSLKGAKTAFVEERPVPLVLSWYSTGSGVAYCTLPSSTTIHLRQAGKWTEEQFSDKPESVRFIFGLPGTTPQEDQLFMTVERGLFVRKGGAWTRHKLKDRHPYQVHGLVPNDVYVAADPPARWDGSALATFGAPDDGGETLGVVWVTADDLLVGGHRSLYISTPQATWQQLDVPLAYYGNLVELGGILYACTNGGMVQVRPPQRTVVGPPIGLRRVMNVGDGLIAAGDSASLVFDGKTWKTIDLPSCEVGKRPK